MAEISDATKAELRSFLPAAASVKNPVDMIASAPLEHYQRTVETVLADPGVDMVMVIYLPFLGLKDTDVAKALMDIKAKHPEKPIIGCFMTENRFFTELSDMKVTVPFYMYAEEAVDAMERLNRQRLWMERPEGVVPAFEVKKDAVRAMFDRVKSEGRTELSTRESMEVLDAYGVRTCRSTFAKTAEEAAAAADAIGYPVVMKMTSTTVSHKTDVGGVRVGLASHDAVLENFRDLVAKLEAKGLAEGFEGVIIQEMVVGKRETVCGIATDPQYGPMMMFGLGGIFVEALEDVAFRLAPLNDQDAKELVRSVKAFKLLQGARGTTPAQIDRVEETLLRLSQLVTDFPEVQELDINPLMISEKNGEPIAVDGRIRIA